jgi:hypothetical protein
MDITLMDTTIRIAIPTTDRIGIMAIGLTMGIVGTAITIVTTDITTIIGGNTPT